MRATHVANALARLDDLRSATAHAIALLKKPRAALIAEVVTGKIPICILSAWAELLMVELPLWRNEFQH
jgi:hypothetical protein